MVKVSEAMVEKLGAEVCENLDRCYYAPSESEEWYDYKTDTYYTSSGNKLRDPSGFSGYNDDHFIDDY